MEPRKRPAYIDERGAEYHDKPQVERHRKLPGSMLQKAGGLLSKNGDDSRFVYEKGRLKPVIVMEEADFYRQDLWKPLPVCTEESDCPCLNCQCCYTETFMCTVRDTCIATLSGTTTSFDVRTTTSTRTVFSSVTAVMTFTLTNTVIFTSTEFVSSTASESPILETSFNVTLATTPSLIFLTTITQTETTIPLTVNSTVSGGPTITISRDVISIIETFGSVYGGLVSATITQMRTFTEGIGVPFTVNGKARTVSPTITKTIIPTVTLEPTIIFSTPGIAVTTREVTQTLTDTLTKIVKECDKVRTARVTATKTFFHTVGTATAAPATRCPENHCPLQN